MRTSIYLSILGLIAAGSLPAGTISLTGSTDVVAFDGSFQSITLGSASCPTPNTGTCTYGGNQALGAGTLSWMFQTPNTTDNITYNPATGVVDGPTGGTFSATDGVDSLSGTYTLTSWASDGEPDASRFTGVDLFGTITVTGSTLLGGGDPNQAAFESYLGVPATSYDFTLDIGDCTAGNRASFCIAPVPDPSGQFISLALNAQGTPEPGTFGPAALGLVGAFALWRRRNKKSLTSNELPSAN